MTRLLTALFLGTLMVPACGPDKVNIEIAEDEMNNPGVLFNNGVALLKAPDKNGVIDYKTAYDRFVSSANIKSTSKAWFNAGWVAEILGDKAAAEEHYRTAYDLDHNYTQAMFSLARVLNEENKNAGAVALYQDFLDKHPDDLEVRNDLVVALSGGQMYEEALSQAQQILRQDPQNATVYRNLSTMYYEQGNYGMSQLCNEKALSLNDGDPGTYNNMGVTFLQQENEAAAIEKFKTALKLDDDNFEANMNLGYVALNSGDYRLALGCFEKASVANAASIDAKLGLAVALRGTGEFAKASAAYDEILAADPQFDIAYYNAATLHEKYTRDFNKALKYLQGYVDAKTGQIGPDHSVFAKIERVKSAKAKEEERKRVEAQKKKEEDERRKRQEAMLKDMTDAVTSLEAKLTANEECLLNAGVLEEAMMINEQAKMVVEMNDASMAADVKQFLDAVVPTVDAAIASCSGGGDDEEPAPGEPVEGEPGDEPAPAPEEGDGGE